MSAVTGAVSQAMVTQMNFSASMLKKQADAQNGFIEMIAKTADASRGGNVDLFA